MGSLTVSRVPSFSHWDAHRYKTPRVTRAGCPPERGCEVEHVGGRPVSVVCQVNRVNPVSRLSKPLTYLKEFSLSLSLSPSPSLSLSLFLGFNVIGSFEVFILNLPWQKVWNAVGQQWSNHCSEPHHEQNISE